MSQQDNKKWENQWEEAFKGVSEAPSPLVWKSVEASLANGGSPNKAWWFWVAAAFLGGVITTTAMFFLLNGHQTQELALQPSTSTDTQSEVSTEELTPTTDQRMFENQKPNLAMDGPMAVVRVPREKNQGYNIGARNSNLVSGRENEAPENHLTATFAHNSSESRLVQIDRIMPQLLPEETISSIEVRGVYIFDPSKFKPKENTDKKAWLAGLAFSSGAFQQSSGGNEMDKASINTTGPVPDPAGFVDYSDMGISSSMAMNVGRRFNKRWMLSAGVGYQITTNQSTSNLILVNESNKDVKNVIGELSASEMAFSNPSADGFQLEVSPDAYKMQNSYQFVTVPLSVGYFLIDKKWKLNLNAGLNTDIFYQYNSRTEASDLQDYVVKPSDDKDWKYLNMSLAGGLELSRVMAHNYVVALAPGYRHAMSEFGVKGNNQLQPNVFHVTLRFNYIF